MAAKRAKNDCNINEVVDILSGLNIESIANINFTSKIRMFRSHIKDCMNADNEIDFYIPRKEFISFAKSNDIELIIAKGKSISDYFLKKLIAQKDR